MDRCPDCGAIDYDCDCIPELPDDPNHPHPWGRPIVLSEEGSKMVLAMMNEPPPPWLAKALERARR